MMMRIPILPHPFFPTCLQDFLPLPFHVIFLATWSCSCFIFLKIRVPSIRSFIIYSNFIHLLSTLIPPNHIILLNPFPQSRFPIPIPILLPIPDPYSHLPTNWAWKMKLTFPISGLFPVVDLVNFPPGYNGRAAPPPPPPDPTPNQIGPKNRPNRPSNRLRSSRPQPFRPSRMKSSRSKSRASNLRSYSAS